MKELTLSVTDPPVKQYARTEEFIDAVAERMRLG